MYVIKASDILGRSEVNQRKVVRPSTVRTMIITLHRGTVRQCRQGRLQITQSIAIKWKQKESRIGIRNVTIDIMKCSLHMLRTQACTQTRQLICCKTHASKHTNVFPTFPHSHRCFCFYFIITKPMILQLQHTTTTTTAVLRPLCPGLPG